MPVYEYLCKGCGHEFEREQRISEDPIKKCPSCGALKAVRQISRTSFVLKGGGWYSDLYGSKPAAKSGGEETTPSAESKPADTDAAAAKAPSESKTDAAAGAGDKPAKGPKKGGKGAKSAA